MIEFTIPGAIVYQLKLQDISRNGAGVIVRPESNFLNLVKIDEHFRVKLLSPVDSQVDQGIYRVRIAHVTESKAGRFKGHVVVGIELLEKIADY